MVRWRRLRHGPDRRCDGDVAVSDLGVPQLIKEILPLVDTPVKAAAVVGVGAAWAAYRYNALHWVRKLTGFDAIRAAKENLEVQIATVKAECASDMEGILDLFPFPVNIQVRNFDEAQGLGTTIIAWVNKAMHEAAGSSDNIHKDPLAAIYHEDIATAIATRNMGLVEGTFVDHVERIVDPHGKLHFCYVRGKRIKYHGKPALVVMLFVLTEGQYKAFQERKILKIEDIFEMYYQQQLAMESVNVGDTY